MILLGLDSATGACSAALWSPEGGVIARRFEAMQRGQAEALAPMIEAVLVEAGMAADGIDGIAVTTGPGAFTGVRIGLSAARALALALARPIIGVTTFDAIVEPLAGNGETPILCVVESRRADFFVQAFASGGGALGDPAAVEGSGVQDYLGTAGVTGAVRLAGDGAARLAASGSLSDHAVERAPGDGLPDAADAARAAWRRVETAGWPPSGVRPSALYLRPPDAKPQDTKPPVSA